MTKCYMSLISTAVVSLVLTVSSGHTTQEESKSPFQSPTLPAQQSINRAFGTAGSTLARLPRMQDPLRQAMEDLKNAEDDDAKDEALDSIRAELEDQYDAFLEANEKQIEDLQTRLDNLREQLVRRRDAKNKMVDLEMERVVNESEGLVWPSRGKYSNNRAVGNLFYSDLNNQPRWNVAPFPSSTTTLSRSRAPGSNTQRQEIRRPRNAR